MNLFDAPKWLDKIEYFFRLLYVLSKRSFHRTFHSRQHKLSKFHHFVLTHTDLLRSTLLALPRYRHTEFGLLLSAALAGIIIGLVVVLFHGAMELAEDAFSFLHKTTDSLLQFGIFLFPFLTALGGLIVGILNSTIFKSIEGEGMGDVVNAVKHRNGFIQGQSSIKAILTAALSISSGGGAGREAPTVLLGAAVGSTVGQALAMRPYQLRTLCAAGSAAAISAIFNAPLGGVVFALEGLIGEINIRSFIPLVVAAVLATATTRIFFGIDPILVSPSFTETPLWEYPLLAIAGASSGLIAVYYLRSFKRTFTFIEDRLAPYHPVWRPAFGGFFVGCIVIALPMLLETTYTPVNTAIAGKFTLSWLPIALLLGTIALKPIVNAITLGSGGAGGTLAPALKTGALFGLLLGIILKLVIPGINPGMYALVCAGAVVAGTFQMPLAASLILFELSGNYNVILPLLLSSVFATFIVQRAGATTFNPLTNSDKH